MNPSTQFRMYKVYIIPESSTKQIMLSQKQEWNGSFKQLRSAQNTLAILNIMLESGCYPSRKNHDDRYILMYPSTDIEILSLLHSSSMSYKIDINEFMSYSDNMSRFYINKQNGHCYYHAQYQYHSTDKDHHNVSKGFLMVCNNLNDFVQLSPEGSSGSAAAGGRGSRRNIKRIISRKKSGKNNRPSRLSSKKRRMEIM